MSNPPKARGTAAESAATRYLVAHGVPTVRVALHGQRDRGDLHCFGGKVVCEVKSRRTWPSPGDIERWMGELERECANVHAFAVGALIVKRPGSGPANAGDWLCYVTHEDWATLTCAPIPRVDLAREWVCVNLGHLAAVLANLPARQGRRHVQPRSR